MSSACPKGTSTPWGTDACYAAATWRKFVTRDASSALVTLVRVEMFWRILTDVIDVTDRASLASSAFFSWLLHDNNDTWLAHEPGVFSSLRPFAWICFMLFLDSNPGWTTATPANGFGAVSTSKKTVEQISSCEMFLKEWNCLKHGEMKEDEK